MAKCSNCGYQGKGCFFFFYYLEIVLLKKSAKINAVFLTGDFHERFHHLLPDSKYWSSILYKFHFKVSPPVTIINAEAWLLQPKD